MPIASAEEPNEIKYDPIVGNYLDTVLNAKGSIVKSNTIGDTEYVERITVKEISENKYKLKSTLMANGELENEENVIIIDNQDNTYQIINKKHGINETFTTVEPISTEGSGSSDLGGARIDLYDSQYGYGPDLEDEYGGCYFGQIPINYADVWVDIDADNGYSYADWNIHNYYNHWCFITHYFDSAEIIHEGGTYNITASGFGEHTFSHSGGWSTYTVELDVIYGNW